jgi:hypothetical protein
MAAPNQITLAQGESKNIELTVLDTDGGPLNITSHGITFTVKDDLDESAFRIQKSVGSGITIVDAPNGRADITLIPGDTAPMQPDNYVYDVWVEPPTSEDFQAIPVSQFKVLPRVTVL